MTASHHFVAAPDRLVTGSPRSIIELVEGLEAALNSMDEGDANRHFLSTYLRTTIAVGEAIDAGLFEDPEWVERWDVAFGQLYLDALEAKTLGRRPPAPWTIAFAAAEDRPDLPPLRHVLLGINAHINYDLPQALLAVMTDADFDHPQTRDRRRRDHRAIDVVLSSRVGAEDMELRRSSRARGMVDRALTPLNRLASRRLLHEARQKVWANAMTLSRARRRGPDHLGDRLADLSALSAGKLEQLVAPGQVLLKLAVTGFGVELAPSSADGRALHHRLRARSFDPRRIGTLERDVWVSYYRRQWARLLVKYMLLVKAGFRMGTLPTLRGAWHVLRANQVWAPFPDNDPDAAHRHMESFYRLVAEEWGEEFDPLEAARLEVEWWRVHRALQRLPESGVTEVDLAKALADLYTYLFGAPREEIGSPARERAAAMVLSDQWVSEGCPPDSPLLVAEEAALVRSYAGLLAAVYR